ncbi:hypothetical protein NDU88_002031 [Pleurodeles waltl]|uniref:Uncharacterized protein n=1 Tax=Pleurodeles waltl TaxID=8319 RepID=A0AAV7Q5J8_PLEWA|nr:hypothetical protein NDU88_002031 [Pleurodeles waltl]
MYAAPSGIRERGWSEKRGDGHTANAENIASFRLRGIRGPRLRRRLKDKSLDYNREENSYYVTLQRETHTAFCHIFHSRIHSED